MTPTSSIRYAALTGRSKTVLGPRFGRRDLLAAVLLAVITVLIYYPLTIQGCVLASFDSLVYFYPNAVYLADQLRAGHIPLWDPYIFAGVPFLANSQVGALYPPSLLYLLGPVSRVYAVLAVGHVWLLAIGIYALGRVSLGLSRRGALFAAIAVAFGGFVGGMDGHLNQVETLAWAPYEIMAVERGAAERSWGWALLSAIPFALAALAGHSQELYMTALVAGLAGASRVIEGWLERGSQQSADSDGEPSPEGLTVRQAATDVLRLAAGPTLAILMSAAQLIPTLELTRVSIRAAGVAFPDATALSLPPPLAMVTLLPTIHQPLLTTEWLGYLGVSALILAAYGVLRRPSREAYWLAAIAIIGLVLAFGKYTPLFHVAFSVVPGVRLYRVPARWLTLWTLGAGLLAGWGLDTLLTTERVKSRVGDSSTKLSVWGRGRAWAAESAAAMRRRPRFATVLVIVLFAVLAWAYHYRHDRQYITWPSAATLVLWGGAIIGLLVVVLLARRWRGIAAAGAILVLTGEMLVAAQGLPLQNAVWIDAVEVHPQSVDYLLAQHSSDRVLAFSSNTWDPGNIAELRKRLAPTLSPSAVLQYITAEKHAADLTPNMPLRFGLRGLDGYDGGVLPLTRFLDLKKLFAVQGPVVPDGRLMLQLKSAPNPRLLAWLNVRWLLMDRLRDQSIDNTYYDLALTKSLASGQPLVLPVYRPFVATSLGIIFRDDDGSPPDGTMTIDAGGQIVHLRVGSGGIAGKAVSSDTDPHGLWLWHVSLNQPTKVSQITLTWNGTKPVALRSLSLINDRTGNSQSVEVNPAYRLRFLGDVKIYENQSVLPRAFLADSLTVVPNMPDVISALKSPTWRAQAQAVSASTSLSSTLAFQSNGQPGQARIVSDRPGDLTVETDAAASRVLVLTDSYYPGWQVTVDGKPQPILPVDILFRGVILPPGQHRVVFSYRPLSWKIGLGLSTFGVLATAIAFGLMLRQRGSS